MARQSKFTPKSTPKGWRINIPAKHSTTGRRERHFYKSKAQAEEAAKSLRGHRNEFGAQARTITPALAEDATAAATLLEPYGITLLEVARRFVDAEKRSKASAVIDAALAEFRAKKADLSRKQVTNYRLMAEHLLEDFAGRIMSAITGAELESHIEAHTDGPAAFNQRLRLIGAFWRWCAKKPRNWCEANELEAMEGKPTIPGEIGILSPDQARKLMATAESEFPEAVPAYAIQLTTGMRKSEVARLLPSDVTPDGISVPPLTARKTLKRRFIHMTPQLQAWLDAYPIGESVCPPDWLRKDRAIRRLAGWRVWCDLLDDPKPGDDLPKWPNNAFRHTAASVALALGKPIEMLVFEHGHTGGLNTLRNHYIGQVSRRDAIAISRIGPKGVTLQVIEAA